MYFGDEDLAQARKDLAKHAVLKELINVQKLIQRD